MTETTRRRLVVVLLLVFVATPAAAQGEAFPRLDIAPSATDGGRPADDTTVRAFGWSGAVKVVLSMPDTPLTPEELVGFGGGWDLGHRWLPLRNEDLRPLPGQPIGAPAEAQVQIGDDLAREGVRTPGEAGVWMLQSGSGTSVTVITQVPAHQATAGRLNGYHIGHYPTAGSDRTDAYAPPPAYVEVTLENRHLQISRHLTLGQFVTKDQTDVWPKYVVLDTRLLDKIELVVQELNAMGVRAERVTIMSGYRTPQYNGPGGDGRATFSRHMWGDAADMWIDNDGDGLIDDLNGDGLIGTDDAAVILRAVERVERKYPELVGGAGVYPANPYHGPFIHIDARGYHSRW